MIFVLAVLILTGVFLFAFYLAASNASSAKSLKAGNLSRLKVLLGADVLKSHTYFEPEGTAYTSVFDWDIPLGYRLRKSMISLSSNSPILTNEQGFASSGRTTFQYGLRKPENTFRIIVIGGSTVLGHGASGIQGTLPAQLAERLRPREQVSGVTFEVINAGISGFYSYQEFLFLLTELLDYGPDLVVVYDGANDVRSSRPGERKDMYASMRERLKESYTVRGSLSHLAQAAVQALPFLNSLARLTDRAPNAPRPDFTDNADIYEENVELMIFLCQRRHIAVGAFLQPVREADNPRAPFYPRFQDVSRRLRATHDRPGKVCVRDLSAVVAGRQDFFEDSVHMSDDGYGFMARKIIESLDESRLLPAAPAVKVN